MGISKLIIDSSVRAQLFVLAVGLGLALALALALGGEVDVASADPEYLNHAYQDDAKELCGDSFDGCGSFCIYGSCTACTKCCQCHGMCTVSQLQDVCVEPGDAPGDPCKRTERRFVDVQEECNQHERTEADGSEQCNDGGGITCGERYDCAPCLDGHWEVYTLRNGTVFQDEENPDPDDADFFGGIQWDFETPYGGKALLFGRLPDPVAHHCSADGFEYDVHPIAVGPLPTTTPQAVYPDDFGDVTRRVRGIGSDSGQPTPAPIKSFGREGSGAPIFKLVKPTGTDWQAEIEVRLSSFDQDEDTLQYRKWAYNGFKPDEFDVPYLDLPLAMGSENKSRILWIYDAGAWSFQVRKLDEDDEPGPGSRVRTALFGMNELTNEVVYPEDITLAVAPLPTPLPTLEGGATRPSSPSIVEIEQYEDVYPHTPKATTRNPDPVTVNNYRVKVTLDAEYTGGVEYRYWTYSGVGFGRVEPEWETATVRGLNFDVDISPSELHGVVVPEEQGRALLFSFQVRQVASAVVSEPSAAFATVVWSFRPYEVPDWANQEPWPQAQVSDCTDGGRYWSVRRQKYTYSNGAYGVRYNSAYRNRLNVKGERYGQGDAQREFDVVKLCVKIFKDQEYGAEYDPDTGDFIRFLTVAADDPDVSWEYTTAWDGVYVESADGRERWCFWEGQYDPDDDKEALMAWHRFDLAGASKDYYGHFEIEPFPVVEPGVLNGQPQERLATDDPDNVPLYAFRLQVRYWYKGRPSHARWDISPTYGAEEVNPKGIRADSHSDSMRSLEYCGQQP